MTREDAVSITSRLVALYFFCWTALNLSFLPSSIFSYWYVRQMFSTRVSGLEAASAHGVEMQVVNLILTLIRIVVGLVLGIWFYRGGVQVRDFFHPESKMQKAEDQL